MSMNQRVALYARPATLDSYGQRSKTYALTGSVWGRVKYLRRNSDSERIVSNKEHPEHKIQIVARKFAGTAGDEIEFDGYRWEIEGVRRKHRNLNTTIIANRVRAVVAVIDYYLQPDGSSFYLTPTADKYLQP